MSKEIYQNSLLQHDHGVHQDDDDLHLNTSMDLSEEQLTKLIQQMDCQDILTFEELLSGEIENRLGSQSVPECPLELVVQAQQELQSKMMFHVTTLSSLITKLVSNSIMMAMRGFMISLMQAYEPQEDMKNGSIQSTDNSGPSELVEPHVLISEATQELLRQISFINNFSQFFMNFQSRCMTYSETSEALNFDQSHFAQMNLENKRTTKALLKSNKLSINDIVKDYTSSPSRDMTQGIKKSSPKSQDDRGHPQINDETKFASDSHNEPIFQNQGQGEVQEKKGRAKELRDSTTKQSEQQNKRSCLVKRSSFRPYKMYKEDLISDHQSPPGLSKMQKREQPINPGIHKNVYNSEDK